jgi:NADPH-dependent curcumin reductase CurA
MREQVSSNYKLVTLRNYCVGVPKIEDFEVLERSLPEIGDGQFLIRNIFASVDPGTRSRLSGVASYAQPLRLGDPVDGFNVGEVMASHNPKFGVGDVVFHAGGWRSHVISSGRGFIGKVPARDLPLSLWIGVLGVPGLTAWFGMHRVGGLKPNQTVLVTSAAGPVGATAGQIAKAAGCRVIGVAGGPAKCAWLRSEAGFDEVIDYKASADLTADLKAASPDGYDMLFDNVGNEMIERVLPMMRMNGRIVVSGQVADYNLSGADVPPIRYTTPFITHRVRMEGLVVFDDMAQFPQALQEMADMIRAGTLKYQEERFEGLDQMPAAFCGLFRGENQGRRIIRLGADPDTVPEH